MTGSRRFSQAISEGDGISVIVEVDAEEAARLAEADGAEAIVVHGGPGSVRDSTELPILSLDADDAEGADACVVDASEVTGDGERLVRAAEHGLDVVVRVRDEEELEAVLEQHDPEIFLLAASREDDADDPLESVLELLPDVPAGKLAIADVEVSSRDEVVALERAGFDAVLAPAGRVGALVGAAPPDV